MQEKLNEILKSLTGSSQKQSVESYSIPKQFAFKTLDAFDALAQQNTKENWSKRLWISIKWYVKNRIIPNKSDDEVRKDLKSIYSVLSPLFETLETATMIQESKKLNDSDSKQQKFVESIPNFKDALEVLGEF